MKQPKVVGVAGVPTSGPLRQQPASIGLAPHARTRETSSRCPLACGYWLYISTWQGRPPEHVSWLQAASYRLYKSCTLPFPSSMSSQQQ